MTIKGAKKHFIYVMGIMALTFIMAVGVPMLCWADDEADAARARAFLAHVEQGDTVEALDMLYSVEQNDPILSAKNERGQTAVMIAIQRGHDELLSNLIMFGADVSAQDNMGATALHYAVRRTDLQLVNALLDNGAQPNDQDNNGFTPLMSVLDVDPYNESHVILAQRLIQAKTDVNKRITQGRFRGATALFFAVGRLMFDVVEGLLNAGADVSPITNSHITPLFVVGAQAVVATANRDMPKLEKCNRMIAILTRHGAITEVVRSGDIVALRALHEQGIDLNEADSEQKAPLMRAAEFGNYRMYTEIRTLRYGDGTRKDAPRVTELAYCWTDSGYNILHAAAIGGNVEILRDVLDSGWKEDHLNDFDGEGETPLMKAAMVGNLAAVQMLFEYGADVNAANKHGETALFSIVRFTLAGMQDHFSETKKALRAQKIEILEYLKHYRRHDRRLNLNAKYNNRSVLFFISSTDWEDRTHRLVNIFCRYNGVDVNEPGRSGDRPLMWAVQINDEVLADALLNNGADMNLSNPNDPEETALSILKEREARGGGAGIFGGNVAKMRKVFDEHMSERD